MTKNYSKRYIFLFLLIIFLIFWTCIAIANFISTLSKTQTKVSNDTLSSIADCNARKVYFTFDRYIAILKTVAKSVEQFEDFESLEVLSFINNVSKENLFSRIAIDYANGKSYISDGYTIDITELNYIDKIKNGEPFILDVVDSIEDLAPNINIVVPIKNKDGVYEVAIRGVISTKDLTNEFEQTFAHAGGYYHIVDGNGKYVSCGNSSSSFLMDINYFNAILKLKYMDGFSAEKIKRDFSNKQSGYSRYSFDNKERYIYYTPVRINNWMLFMIIPKEVAQKNISLHAKNVLLLIIQIIVILLIFTFYVFFSQKCLRNDSLLNEKCFKIIAEQTNKAIFEWDFTKNKITALSNFEPLFGINISAYNFSEADVSSKLIYDDDREIFDEIFNTVINGNDIKNVKLRILDNEGIYHWCNFSVVIVKHKKIGAYKAVGSIENIDEQIRREEFLRKKSEIDQLTGLYNKKTTEFLIKEILAQSDKSKDKHILLVIDIDNFKSINDNLGHLYGDIVLSKLSDLLKPIFHVDDIVGRIGGDEFFVLLKNCKTIEIAKKKASEICQKFCKTYTEANISVDISSSIGISIYPEHATTFDELYKAADVALYNSKYYGKNRYTIFDGTNLNTYKSNRTEIDLYGGIQKNFESNRTEYMFKLLYGSENPNVAIIAVLKLLTEHFDFSRVNVFEVNNDIISCTFEWCDKGVESIKEREQNLKKENYDHIYVLGDFFIKKVEDLPVDKQKYYKDRNIKNLIYFAIMNKDKLMGSITFQDCINEDLKLTDSDIDEIRTTCQVLSTFILKQQLHEKEKQHKFVVETVLNNMDGFAYVIDKDTLKVLYENNQIQEVTKTLNIGRVCYKAYMGRDSMCDVCPITGLSDEVSKCAVDINNEEYGIYSRTTGAIIDWINGKKAYLISSIDVSEYKKNNIN